MKFDEIVKTEKNNIDNLNIDIDKRIKIDNANGLNSRHNFIDSKVMIKTENGYVYDTNKDYYENYIDYIYNRHPAEFIYNFENDIIIDDILDKISFEWQNLYEGEKRSLINEFKNVLCEKLDITYKPSIVYGDMDKMESGEFIKEDNEILINKNLLNDPKELIDTMAHEIRHAYQWQCAERGENVQDILFRTSFENYIMPFTQDEITQNFMDYKQQLVEADADAFADLFKLRGADNV